MAISFTSLKILEKIKQFECPRSLECVLEAILFCTIYCSKINNVDSALSSPTINFVSLFAQQLKWNNFLNSFSPSCLKTVLKYFKTPIRMDGKRQCRRGILKQCQHPKLDGYITLTSHQWVNKWAERWKMILSVVLKE